MSPRSLSLNGQPEPARPTERPAAAPPPVRTMLVGPDDPPPVTVYNPDGRAPVLLLCDHASRAMPAALGTLGLDEAALSRHIAYDIGAADVARHLSDALDAPLILSGYSRLIIDINRPLDDPTSIPVISDGVVVSGNRTLDADDVTRRAEEIFEPYHRTVRDRLDGYRERGIAPAVISIHSCTPVMHGIERPWHIGVLWDRDPRIPVPLMERLAHNPDLCVGDNEPYSGRNGNGYTIETHATPRGLPNVLIEVRQDLIDTRQGCRVWAALLAEPLAAILADTDLYSVERY